MGPWDSWSESWGWVSCLPDSQSPCALVSSEAGDLTAVGMVRGLQCSFYTRLSWVGIWEIQGSETHFRLPSIAFHQQSAWLLYLEKLRHKKQLFPQLQGNYLEWQVGKFFFFFLKIIFGAPNPVGSLRSAEGLGLLGGSSSLAWELHWDKAGAPWEFSSLWNSNCTTLNAQKDT